MERSKKKTFKGYQDSEILLETSKYLNMRDGESVNREIPCPWKR